MAWEWSHSNEAYTNVEANIRNRPHDWLAVVYAEWEALTRNDDRGKPINPHFDEAAYDIARMEAEQIPDDVLAEYIADKASEHRECTNGGHFAYCCPYNCGAHEVSFDREDDTNEDDGEEEGE